MQLISVCAYLDFKNIRKKR